MSDFHEIKIRDTICPARECYSPKRLSKKIFGCDKFPKGCPRKYIDRGYNLMIRRDLDRKFK